MTKRIAAVALQHRIGETFSAVVTGVTPKGVFVRASSVPAEVPFVRGQQGVDVGDHAKLVSADPAWISGFCQVVAAGLTPPA